MLSFKFIAFCLMMSAVCHSCAPASRTFSEQRNMNADFYQMLVDYARSEGVDDSIIGVDVYKAVFRERFVENNNVVEYTLLNSESTKPVVRYQDVFGFTQHLYIFKLIIPGSTSSPCIYFSVKYKANMKGMPGEVVCIGFGPAYYGNINNELKNVRFEKEILAKPVKKDDRYVLKTMDENTSMLFNFDSSINQAGTKKFVDIVKVVQFRHNKIGGDKSLVYDIRKVFDDPFAMRFTLNKEIRF